MLSMGCEDGPHSSCHTCLSKWLEMPLYDIYNWHVTGFLKNLSSTNHAIWCKITGKPMYFSKITCMNMSHRWSYQFTQLNQLKQPHSFTWAISATTPCPSTLDHYLARVEEGSVTLHGPSGSRQMNTLFITSEGEGIIEGFRYSQIAHILYFDSRNSAFSGWE